MAEGVRRDGSGRPLPSTGGSLQSLCLYQDLDAGCALKAIVNIRTDPLGPPAGYWYASDGSTFVFVAVWEGNAPLPDGFECPARVRAQKGRNAICRGN